VNTGEDSINDTYALTLFLIGGSGLLCVLLPVGPERLSAAVCALPLQVKLWYDKVGHQLIVTILGAKDLPPREDGRPRNPYVKIYFLPDRR